MFSAFCLLLGKAYAAGSLLTTTTQKPVKWFELPVGYNLDQGKLGPLSNSEAAALVKQAFDAWSDTETSSLSYVRHSDLSRDLTGDNLTSSSALFSVLNGEFSGMNPVIFDEDGSITDNLQGQGASKQILGFAQPRVYSDGEIFQAYIVLNGLFLMPESEGGMGLTSEEYLPTVIHELGHLVGLDHTQVNRHLWLDGVGWNDAHIPMMFPTLSDDESVRTEPTFDDRVSLSSSYPTTTGEFTSKYGRISGTAKMRRDSDLVPLLGGNVIARNVDDPLGTATSCVTDYLADEDGLFELQGLPAGNYEVWIEPLNPGFDGVSRIGPYSQSSSGYSFTYPPMPEYYNGESESESSSEDSRSRVEFVSVKKGKTNTIKLLCEKLDISTALGEGELETQILAYGSPMQGAAPAKLGGGRVVVRGTVFSVVVNDDDQSLRIELDAENNIDLGLLVAHNRKVHVNDYDYTMRTSSADEVLEFFRGGNPTLQTGTYFIDVRNETFSDESFTLTVYSDKEATPTPTPSPSPSPSPTPTPTPPDFAARLFQFSGQWQRDVNADNVRFDFNQDGLQIDEQDLVRFPRE